MENEHDGLFNTEELGNPATGIKKPSNLLPVVIVVLGLGVMGAIYFFAGGYLSHRTAAQSSAPAEIDQTDIGKRELTAFVEQFLLAYYCYSAGPVYDQAVARAEAMMTPAFQAAYNDRAQDLTFKQKLENDRVSTDGIKILPGSVTIGSQGNHYMIQLAGTMTFTTGVNGATGDFPLSLLLSIYRTDTGFLVDNVERLR